MKKRIIISGIVVVLGIIWCGCSWYTGKKIETEINSEINNLFQELSKYYPDENINFSVTNYQRGIFSSTFDYKINASFKSNELDDILSFPIEDKLTVYHGPFPLSRIKSFDFLPRFLAADVDMASLITKLNNRELTKIFNEFQEVTQKEQPITFAIDAYNKNTELSFNISPLNIKGRNDQHLEFSGLASKTTISQNGKFDDIQSQAYINKIYLSLSNEEIINVDKVKMDLSNKSNANSEVLFSVDDFRIRPFLFLGSSFNNKAIVIKNYRLQQEQTPIKNDKADYIFTNSVDSFAINNFSIGSGELKVSLKDLPVSWFNTISLEQVLPAPCEKINGILSETDKIGISLDHFTWKNSAGNSTIALAATFGQNNSLNEEDSDEMFDCIPFRQFDANISISVPMLTELASQMKLLKASETKTLTPEMQDEIKSQSNNEMTMVVELFKTMAAPFIKITDNTVESTIKYLPQEKAFNINGNVMTIEQIDEILSTLFDY